MGIEEEFNLLLASEEQGSEPTLLETVLSFLAKGESIILRKDIGLIGYNGTQKVDREHLNMDAYSETELAYINNIKVIPNRGREYEVVNEDGEIVLGERITHTFVNLETNDIVFVLSNQGEGESLFNISNDLKAVAIIDNEVIRDGIKVEEIRIGEYRVEYKGNVYNSHVYNKENKIYNLIRRR